MYPDGSFDYYSDPGFSGEDDFSYIAADGMKESGVATVTIVVHDAAAPPAPTPQQPQATPTPTPTATPDPPQASNVLRLPFVVGD